MQYFYACLYTLRFRCRVVEDGRDICKGYASFGLRFGVEIRWG